MRQRVDEHESVGGTVNGISLERTEDVANDALVRELAGGARMDESLVA